jgi:hypothetical protein
MPVELLRVSVGENFHTGFGEHAEDLAASVE